MNLDKYSTKESQEELIKNKSEFFDVIVESNGFILEMLKTNDVKPDLDMLLENVTLHTIKYIADNYQLNEEQHEKIKEFEKDDRPQIRKLTQEEIETYLKEKKALPSGTILSFEQINKFHKEIEEQFDLDYSDMEDILERSFSKLTLEESLKVERKLLEKNSYIMNANPSFFNNEEYGELYKQLILKRYKKPELKLFRHYIFTEKDRELLYKLLDNGNFKGYNPDSYSDYTHIKGFSTLIDKYEFFTKYNSSNINHFSDNEIEENLELFKKAYLENADRKHYEIFSGFFSKKMSIKQFKTIFDEDFVERYIEQLSDNDRGISRFFNSNDAEYDQSIIDKEAHLAKIISSLFAQDKVLKNGKKITEITDLYYLFQLKNDLKHKKNRPLDPVATEEDKEQLDKNLHVVFNNILPQFLKNDKFESLAKHADGIIYYLTIDLASEFFKNNANVNNFYLLASVYEEYRDKHVHNYSKMEFINTLKEYLSTMHSDLIKRNNHDELTGINLILRDLKKYKENKYKEKQAKKEDPYIVGLIKNTPNRSGFINSDDNNFLSYETNGINESTMWKHVYSLRPELVDYVLEKNIIPAREFINLCLNRVEDATSLKLVKEFAKKNRGYIEKDEELLAAYLANSRQEEIFPLENKEHLELYFAEVLDLLKRQKFIREKEKEIEKLFPHKDMPYSFSREYPQIDIEKFDENIDIAKDISEKEAKTLYLYLYKKAELLSNKLDTKGKLISYSFMYDKLEEFITKKDFYSIEKISESRIKYTYKPFINYVNNIEFDDLKNNLSDESFFKLLKKQINYDEKTNIQFPKFTYEQNTELAIILLKKYREEYGSEGIHYSYKFLKFFAEENRDFIKEFVLEHFPVSVFYGYDFGPENSFSVRDNKYIKGTYSNEQIYKAFMKMEENGGFLGYRDVNADYKSFFTNVFFPERRSGKEQVNDTRFKSFLTFIKDKSPMLYSLMANEHIFSSVLDIGRASEEKTPKYRTRDEGAHHYILENFDLDIILKGMQEIVDQMAAKKLNKDGQDIINKKLASYAITSFIIYTSYEVFDETYSGNNTYESCMSHEDTLKVMKFLFEQAPQHFLERRRVGQALDMVGFFANNIDNFYSLENIKNFILPNSEIHCENLQLSDSNYGESDSKKRLLNYTRIIIERAVEKKDKQVLNFMIHSIAQHKFVKEYEEKNHHYNFYKGINSQVIDIIASDRIIEGLLSNAKLKIDLDETLIINEPVKKKSNKL